MAHAPFQPDVRGTPIPDVRVRAALPGDAQAIARIDAVCMQLHPPTIVPLIEASLTKIVAGDETRAVFVAEVKGSIGGYGKCGWLVHPAYPDMPQGWYLNGLEVLPELRRGGVGTQLTRHRLAWLDRRTTIVWYITGVANQASRAMHRGFGFERVAQGITTPPGSGSTPKISDLLRRRT